MKNGFHKVEAVSVKPNQRCIDTVQAGAGHQPDIKLG
jgi:hypothetical protein